MLRMRVGLGLAVALAAASASPSDRGFEERVNEGRLLYHSSTDYASVLKAVDAFDEVCRRWEAEWLAHYWAAFVRTQAALAGRDTDEWPKLLREARGHLDRASELSPAPSGRDRSELEVLESLLLGFERGLVRDDPQAMEALRERSREALVRAIGADPSNPRVYLLGGTSLVARAQGDGDLLAMLAGRTLLEEAERRYAGQPPEQPVDPSWGRDWIGTWLGRATLDAPETP